MPTPAKNTICLWYDRDAEAAARFYAETFPDSKVLAVHRAPGDYPSGQQGNVLTVEFTVIGIPDCHRRPGRNRPLLERHHEQRRPGKSVRLVQG
jgi:predicted 3-demethylubiquinone-9 3-methyltransferase (glyoxalase superfamily)